MVFEEVFQVFFSRVCVWYSRMQTFVMGKAPYQPRDEGAEDLQGACHLSAVVGA